MSDEFGTRQALLDTGLALIAHQGWHRTTILQIVTELGAPMGEALRLMPGKIGLLHALMERIDIAMEEGVGEWSAADPEQDRLFDAAMARFEAMNQNRDAIIAVLKGVMIDPVAAAASARRYDQSMDRTLECAGLSAGLVAGMARRAALAAVMADATRIWMQDETEGLEQVMATLSTRLGQLEALRDRAGALIPGELING